MVSYGPPVIFLCDTLITAVTDNALKIFRGAQVGSPVVSKRWIKSHTDQPLARFTVRLESNDRKLKRHRPWLRRHLFDGSRDPDDSFVVHVIDIWSIALAKSRRRRSSSASANRRPRLARGRTRRWYPRPTTRSELDPDQARMALEPKSIDECPASRVGAAHRPLEPADVRNSNRRAHQMM
jgi:hypothetical protein